MKKIISVYIIFAFLLMSFVGCGKLKNSPVSGLNQSEASNSLEVNSQSEASNSLEVNSQSEASNSLEVNSQSEASNSLEVNSQSEASNSLEVNSQSEASNSLEVNSQSEASSEIGVKDLIKKESWTDWVCRQWNDNKWYWISGTAAVVSVAVCAGVCYRYSNLITFQKNINPTTLDKEYLNWQKRLEFFSVNIRELPPAERLDWRKKNIFTRSNMWFNVANDILVNFAAFEDKSDLTNVKPFLLDVLSNPKYNYPIDIKRRLRNRAIELYPNMAGFLNGIRMPDYNSCIG
ncbi:hypothetical protein ATZ36_05075 [Candidatus Endomicrobiellum trichonymphae]|uniref:Lipoprotein n=1 Tax=Endomicrobium trichonymphae TaxID=1408204 RepID=A0A1E5IIG7_ENDTX|nr:hypothetical protein ATZ36_05075 [Candidatus Endomicrobium trichonymphae]